MKEKDIVEELFCTNFELKNLSDLLVYGKAERWIYGFMFKKYEQEHLDRYKYILKYTKDKNVLDIASGCGYGTYLIATEGKANQVIGADLNEDAIRYGNHRYPHENIKRFVADGATFKYDSLFDTIISFETIEHVPNYLDFVNNLYANLKDNGTLIISTPITKTTNTKPNNPFHVIEWNFYDFHKLFKDKFEIMDIILQEIRIPPFKKRNEYTIKNRILNRISPEKTQKPTIGQPIEKFTNQYDMNLVDEGYQTLILKKKNNV